MIQLVLLACTDGDPGPGQQRAVVDCVLDEQNHLRGLCTATLTSSDSLELVVSADGEPTRTYASGQAVEHSLTAWGLAPDTVYTWTLAGQTGTFTTRQPPDAFDALDLTVEGTPTGFDAVLQALPCGGQDWFVMLDGTGRILWYQEVPEYGQGGRGYEWAPESRSLMATTADLFLELDISGQELLRLERDTHFSDELHHDVSRWGRYTYLLAEYPEDGKNLDRVDVFEGEAHLGSWFLSDTYDPRENPNQGGEEWSHGNGLNVTPAGQAIFSTLSFSAAVAFDADPDSPTFLAHQFLAAGASASLPDPDYTPLSPAAGFGQQHAIHRVDDELFLFDNQGDGLLSRALRLQLEHDRSGLAMREEWPMGTSCRAQGGAYPLDGGGVLATCAPNGDVWAFASGQTEPIWTLNAWCGENNDSPIHFPKAIPIQIR